MWTQEEGIKLCRLLEMVAPKYGAHVALTGGLLYKDGIRKDADILFYRIRQAPEISIDAMFAELDGLGVKVKGGFAWLYKAEYMGKPIDFFFPEEQGENPYGDDQ
tara:strand:- start:3736 stop:4050 length:315 start_codon:yes stop_codon:yes gene_type:complete